MNFKKFKRLLSVTLSASMLLSTNMTALATETAAPIQANTAVEQEIQSNDLQSDTEIIKEATADEAGISTYISEDGSIGYKALTLSNQDDETGMTPREGEVASIGETSYTTLAEAITAAKANTDPSGKTITLISDATLDANQTLDGLTISTDASKIIISGTGSK